MKLKSLLIVPLLVTSLQAASVSDLTFHLTAGGYILAECDATATGSLVIPSTYNGQQVFEISNGAFSSCTQLTSITIPEGVNHIGISAFLECTSLTNITIPNSVTSIGRYAFQNCSSLTDVVLPQLSEISENLFNGCTSLADITIPSSANSIGVKAFKNCSSLKSISIPNQVTHIYENAFSSCTSLNTVFLGNSISSIGTASFSGCGYESITIPSSIQEIGDYAFSGAALRSIIIESEIAPTLGTDPFWAVGTTEISVPSNSTGYGNSYGNLTVRVNPWGWENIFGSSGVRILSSTASGEVFIPYQLNGKAILEVGGGSSIFGNSNDTVTSVIIPDSVNRINEYAFSSCTNMNSVIIGKSVINIGEGTFLNCNSLSSIKFEGLYSPIVGASAFTGIAATQVLVPSDSYGYGDTFQGLAVIEEYTGPLVFQLAGSDDGPDTEYTVVGCHTDASGILEIPASYMGLPVRRIMTHAIHNCYDLTGIVIPEGVTHLSNEPFTGCVNVTNITLPSSLLTIPDYAFYNLSSLTNIVIPEGVTLIGGGAFNSCISLTAVTIPANVRTISGDAFHNCTNLTSITSNAVTAPNLSVGSSNGVFQGIATTEILVPWGSGQSYLDAYDGNTYGGLSVTYETLSVAEIDLVISSTRIEGQQDVINNPVAYNLYTADDIQDLRAGSTMIAVSGNQATVQLQMEESSDLQSWEDAGDPATMTIPADTDTKFFRFKMAE